MFKRLIAALLSLALCLSSLASSLAEEPVYIYPEIRMTLLPDDRAALEMSFRQWAQAVIFDYYSGVYSASGSSRATHMGQPFGEYYRLAYSKQAFDKENIGNKNILYNTHRDADLILFSNENGTRYEADFSFWLTGMERGVAALR